MRLDKAFNSKQSNEKYVDIEVNVDIGQENEIFRIERMYENKLHYLRITHVTTAKVLRLNLLLFHFRFNLIAFLLGSLREKGTTNQYCFF